MFGFVHTIQSRFATSPQLFHVVHDLFNYHRKPLHVVATVWVMYLYCCKWSRLQSSVVSLLC